MRWHNVLRIKYFNMQHKNMKSGSETVTLATIASHRLGNERVDPWCYLI